MSAKVSTGPARDVAVRLRRLRADKLDLPVVALGLLLVVSGLFLLHQGRNTTFFYDDWNFVLQRRDWSIHDLLYPHNEHLSLVPVLIYKVLFTVVGLAHYGVFRAVLVCLDLLTGALLFVYARRRVDPWIALALTASLVLMGPAFWDVLWAFQMGFVGSCAAGVGALLALDRHDRAGDVLGCVLITLALASSSIGIPIAGAALIEVLWRPDRVRRLWVAAVPIALYLLWYAFYGVNSAKLHNLPAVPSWIYVGAGAASGAISGLGATYGPIIVLILVIGAVWEVSRPGRPSERLMMVIALPLMFWTLGALARADQGVGADEARYLYPSGFFVALLALELARRHAVAPRAAVALAAVLALGAAANAAQLSGGAGQLRVFTENTLGTVSALNVLGPKHVPSPDYIPNLGETQIHAGWYFAAVHQYGSNPGLSPAALIHADPVVRGTANTMVIAALAPALRAPVPSPTGATSPVTISVTGGSTIRQGPCLTLTASSPLSDLRLYLPAGGVTVRAERGVTQLRLNRFADGYTAAPFATLAAGTAGTLALPADNSPQPWQLDVQSAGRTVVCTA